MERRTLTVAVGILAVLGVAAVAGLSTSSADLGERWVSDTPRDNRVNHHPVAVGPNGSVYAPVAEVAGHPDIDETSCSLVRLDPASGAVEWRWSVRPANCTSHAITGPTLADVGGDGSTEALIATTEQALHAIDATSGREEGRVALETYGYGPPVAADLRDGPEPEIVVSDIGASVSLVANRSLEWRRSLDGNTWAAPIVADVTGDGRTEVVVGTSDRVVALSPAGERLWTADADGPRPAGRPLHPPRRRPPR
jgi:outer membrane protein assembly factor BamB